MSVAIRRLRGNSKKLVNLGAFQLGLLTGFVAYWNYRFKIKKEFLVSHGLHKFNGPAKNKTPWESQWLTWFRMPEQEFMVYHRFRPYYVIGQIDYTKEVLIPSTKTIGGRRVDGFDVINPLYCYDGGRLNLQNARDAKTKDKIIDTDRAAIILNRGWIPYSMKDKKSRPWETNSRQLVKVYGTFLQAKDIHDYSKPNNPDNNEWYNLAPEDLARFWELPNFSELKYFYFQQVDLDNLGGATVNNSKEVYAWPNIPTKEDVIRNYYNWWCHEKYNKLIYYTLTPVSVASLALFYLTI